MNDRRGPDPQDAVHAWWQAWQSKDLATIERMACEDYVEYGGAGRNRNVGRERLVEVAGRFFDAATIEDWAVVDVLVRVHESTAVCSYQWSEHGVRGGERFEVEGLALDVLVLRDGAWRYQAHHVSTFAPST
jgi:ketosteroid isomerase-like protein